VLGSNFFLEFIVHYLVKQNKQVLNYCSSYWQYVDSDVLNSMRLAPKMRPICLTVHIFKMHEPLGVILAHFNTAWF